MGREGGHARVPRRAQDPEPREGAGGRGPCWSRTGRASRGTSPGPEEQATSPGSHFAGSLSGWDAGGHAWQPDVQPQAPAANPGAQAAEATLRASLPTRPSIPALLLTPLPGGQHWTRLGASGGRRLCVLGLALRQHRLHPGQLALEAPLADPPTLPHPRACLHFCVHACARVHVLTRIRPSVRPVAAGPGFKQRGAFLQASGQAGRAALGATRRQAPAGMGASRTLTPWGRLFGPLRLTHWGKPWEAAGAAPAQGRRRGSGDQAQAARVASGLQGPCCGVCRGCIVASHLWTPGPGPHVGQGQ